MWPFNLFILRRAHNNEVKRFEKLIHGLGLKIVARDSIIKDLQAELDLARKNDHRDPKTGRFIKAVK